MGKLRDRLDRELPNNIEVEENAQRIRLYSDNSTISFKIKDFCEIEMLPGSVQIITEHATIDVDTYGHVVVSV